VRIRNFCGGHLVVGVARALVIPAFAGRWVLTTACGQLAAWAKDGATRHLTMAVKVSGQQFHEHDFVEQVCQVLKETGARPTQLKLELNESLLIADVEDIISKTNALKEHGVSFSLADLGTGYSSLSHLKRLSLDQLRIDQSFVRGLLTNSNDAAVTKSIFALADSLDLQVSAEGVETQEQHDALAAHGCSVYQGYFFSQPLGAEEFSKLLRQR
jgi:EAL domain-containing protein (putative c-di-GMP-specific phosphodiesterase class I)